MSGPSIQARMSKEDPRLYSVNRDVAHNFGDVMQIVADRLEGEAWPELAELLKRHNVTQDELGEACKALCLFVCQATDVPKENMLDCLTRHGWFKIQPEAQIAITAVLGTVILGYYFAGVREATLGGEGPVLRYQDLAQRGAECARNMTMPKWRRWFYGLGVRLQRSYNALRGK